MFLDNLSECDILYTTKRRCSILVRSAGSEEGPKNPLKGITVKPLVPAAYAQFGVGAEWEARFFLALADVGRSPMAWGSRPSIRGDLCLCMSVLPWWYFPTHVRLRVVTCKAVQFGACAVSAVCRVACLAWVWRIGDQPNDPWPGRVWNCSLKPYLQKRL